MVTGIRHGTIDEQFIIKRNADFTKGGFLSAREVGKGMVFDLQASRTDLAKILKGDDVLRIESVNLFDNQRTIKDLVNVVKAWHQREQRPIFTP